MTQIRGAFPLPQTSPQISGNVQVVCLVSGGTYVPPSGNYLINTGPDTDLQWFDPLATRWRPIAPHIALTPLNCDGVNYRLYNSSGSVDSVTISGAGSAGTNGIGPIQTGTTLSIAASPTGLQAQAYVIIGGSVPAPTLVQGGSGFTTVPIICCDPPPVGGIQATFTATIAGGVITAITLVNAGAGYTSIPQFYVVPQPALWQGGPPWPGGPVQPWPGPGSINSANVWPGTVYQPDIAPNGALISGNPLTGSGTVTGITVIAGGGGYATAPAVSFAGGTLTGMTATAVLDATAAATDTSYVQGSVN